MKKISIIFLIILISFSVVLLGFGYNEKLEPNRYYQVYLDNELLGTVKSKEELEKYIDKRGEYIKKKYNVDKIYKPNGLEIKKVTTYEDKLKTVQEIYDEILDKKEFTISGYQFTINKDDKNQKIYVLDKDIFEQSVTDTIKVFVGKEKYEDYKNNTQKEIATTGSYANDIYIDENITIKEVNIPVNEKIYTSSKELSKYLLFGTTEDQKVYTVQLGDTIPTLADSNQISTMEFLISNPEYTSENNLLTPGQQVTIGITNPQISVVIEENIVEDVVDKFGVSEEIDPDRPIGDDIVKQEGIDGLSRISKTEKKINGIIIYSNTTSREILKPSVDKVVSKGGKYIPHVGSLTSWQWPTERGWYITDSFVWRINPITGVRERHSGVDISGPGYYSPIFAANNGTIDTKARRYDYGNYIIINHNNGYYTVYGHMAAFAKVKVGDVVQRGQVIGYMGSTGYSTGTHLHFEIWKDCRFCRLNPMSFY